MESNPVHRNHPLDLNTSSIRLLEILDIGTEAIKLRFNVRKLDSHPAYFALSYNWGLEDDGFEIEIDGYSFSVRNNLKDFLVRAHDRQEWYSRVACLEQKPMLWIDAICIDQKNMAERNRQVQLMGEIYKRAALVCVWLGLSSNDSGIAIDCLSRIKSSSTDNNLFVETLQQSLPNTLSQLIGQGSSFHTPPVKLSGPWSTAEAGAIKALFERPYWRRIWIIQEFVLAKRILLLCDAKSTRLWAVDDLISKLTTIDGQVITAYRDIFDSSALRILESRLWWRKDSKAEHPGLPLPNLLITFAYADATDVRDKVYGLLSLTHSNWKFHINYNKSAIQIYRDVLDLISAAKDRSFVKSRADCYAFCRILQ